MKNKLLIILVASLIMGCKTYNAPNGNFFPWGWGEPPQIQTKDRVLLPANYGYGSSTLKRWIELNLHRDKINSELDEFQIPLSEIAD